MTHKINIPLAIYFTLTFILLFGVVSVSWGQNKVDVCTVGSSGLKHKLGVDNNTDKVLENARLAMPMSEAAYKNLSMSGATRYEYVDGILYVELGDIPPGASGWLIATTYCPEDLEGLEWTLEQGKNPIAGFFSDIKGFIKKRTERPKTERPKALTSKRPAQQTRPVGLNMSGLREAIRSAPDQILSYGHQVSGTNISIQMQEIFDSDGKVRIVGTVFDEVHNPETGRGQITNVGDFSGNEGDTTSGQQITSGFGGVSVGGVTAAVDDISGQGEGVSDKDFWNKYGQHILNALKAKLKFIETGGRVPGEDGKKKDKKGVITTPETKTTEEPPPKPSKKTSLLHEIWKGTFPGWDYPFK